LGRIYTVLKQWLEKYWQDTAPNKELVASLRQFLQDKMIPDGLVAEARLLGELLDKQIKGYLFIHLFIYLDTAFIHL
jgi:hypothetical protein